MRKFSKELSFLIAAVRKVVLKQELEVDYAIDSLQLLDKMAFHSIRLVMNAFLGEGGPLPHIKSSVKQFAQEQALVSLQQQMELDRLREFFRDKNIPLMPLKGVLFTKLVYKNKQLREYSDLDLLFRQKDARTAFELLLQMGYQPQLSKGMSRYRDVGEIFDSPIIEYPLQKDFMFVDFHWGLCYPFLPYRVDSDQLFENTDLHGLPPKEEIFLSMLLHHGGKECWLKLKNLVDLHAFLALSGVDWDRVIHLTSGAGLLHTLKNGLYYLKHVFQVTDLPLPLATLIHAHRPKNEAHTYRYWERSRHWGRPLHRLYYERILALQQDQGYSFFRYAKKFYTYYATPAPQETARYISFPKSWKFANFISKLVSYFIRKMQWPK